MLVPVSVITYYKEGARILYQLLNLFYKLVIFFSFLRDNLKNLEQIYMYGLLKWQVV